MLKKASIKTGLTPSAILFWFKWRCTSRYQLINCVSMFCKGWAWKVKRVEELLRRQSAAMNSRLASSKVDVNRVEAFEWVSPKSRPQLFRFPCYSTNLWTSSLPNKSFVRRMRLGQVMRIASHMEWDARIFCATFLARLWRKLCPYPSCNDLVSFNKDWITHMTPKFDVDKGRPRCVVASEHDGLARGRQP